MSLYSFEPVVDSQLYDVEEIRRLYDLFDVSFIQYFFINYAKIYN